MNERVLFDDADSLEPAEPLPGVQRSASTPETRDRYTFLKTKKLGAVWEEAGGRLYRFGADRSDGIRPRQVGVKHEFVPGVWTAGPRRHRGVARKLRD